MISGPYQRQSMSFASRSTSARMSPRPKASYTARTVSRFCFAFIAASGALPGGPMRGLRTARRGGSGGARVAREIRRDQLAARAFAGVGPQVGAGAGEAVEE